MKMNSNLANDFKKIMKLKKELADIRKRISPEINSKNKEIKEIFKEILQKNKFLLNQDNVDYLFKIYHSSDGERAKKLEDMKIIIKQAELFELDAFGSQLEKYKEL